MATTDEHADLNRAREAARETHRATEAMLEFAQRMSAVIGPAEVAEYDNLVAREAAAVSRRVEAFERLGLGVASLEATGDPDS
jgi:hypothetical protein